MATKQSSEWFKNAIIYQIMIDRFSGCGKNPNTSNFLGGNLRGITEKLDYISGLGVNAIWLSPFYETSAYHGYHITNFKKVDPHFGTTDDLRELIDKAHEKQIKVVADFVPNHCSSHHPFFEEAKKDINSKHHNWFYFKNWPDDYLCFLDVKELPKINLDNADARNYMLDAANYWLSAGLDGYRVDHIVGPSHDFWKFFYKNIKQKYSDAVLFGEAWGGGMDPKYFQTINFNNKFWRKIFGVSQEKLQLEYCGEFDGILDFALNEMIVETVKKGENLVKNKKFLARVDRHLKKFPKNCSPVIFLDNHDMDRFLKHCNGDTNILLQAIEFLLSLNRPTIIYYGTENGIYNKTPITINDGGSDLFAREPFDWNNLNSDLYNKLRALFGKHNRAPIHSKTKNPSAQG